MFSLFNIVFILFLCVFIGVLASIVVRWVKNNNSPRLSVPATVVSKRAHRSSSHMHSTNSAMHMSTHTTYYITFQFDSGDRMELSVYGSEYGVIIEGDVGVLTFQGTRFVSFERKLSD